MGRDGMMIIRAPVEHLDRVFSKSNMLTLEGCARVADRAIDILGELPWIKQYLEGGAESLKNEDIRATLINCLKHQASQEGSSGPVSLDARLYMAAGTTASSFLRYLEEEAPKRLLDLPPNQALELDGQLTGVFAALILQESPKFREV